MLLNYSTTALLKKTDEWASFNLSLEKIPLEIAS